MKTNSDVATAANPSKPQSADVNFGTKLMPPYLRYSIPAERAQIEAMKRAVKRELLLSGPPLDATSHATHGLVAGSPVSEPHLDVSTISASVNSAVKARGLVNATVSPTAPPTGSSGIPTGAGNQKVAAPGSIIPDGVVSLGWYCPTEFKVNCFTGQTGTKYVYDLYCGQEKFSLGENNNGTLYFELDGQTYGLGAKASNGTLPVTVVCEVQNRKSSYSVELPVTLSFVNQPPCISVQSISFPDEQDPCTLVGGNHGQRPKIRVDLTAPAGPSGQTVFLFMDDPHKPPVGRWVNPGIDSFDIPFGQTSGEWEGFLGTKAVLLEKTISIRARVNGQKSNSLVIKVKRN